MPKDSLTWTNSSLRRLWQQLDVMRRAFRWAVMLKKSKYIRQELTPLAWRMALLCFFERVSRAKREHKYKPITLYISRTGFDRSLPKLPSNSKKAIKILNQMKINKHILTVCHT